MTKRYKVWAQIESYDDADNTHQNEDEPEEVYETGSLEDAQSFIASVDILGMMGGS